MVLGHTGEQITSQFLISLKFLGLMESFEDKMTVLRGSKKLLETDQMKNLFVKPNQTAEERSREKELRQEVRKLRNELKDTDTRFPVIRSGDIIFLERKTQKMNNAETEMEAQPNNKNNGAIPKIRARRNSKA